jgi:hypothetical protein
MITMPVDGLLVVRFRGRDCGAEETYTIERARAPSSFDDLVALAGGLSPGEAKNLLAVDGTLLMNEDGSLTLIRTGIGPEIPVQTEEIQPGTARYDELISRVGEMVPGERRRVLRPVGG